MKRIFSMRTTKKSSNLLAQIDFYMTCQGMFCGAKFILIIIDKTLSFIYVASLKTLQNCPLRAEVKIVVLQKEISRENGRS